MDYSLKYAINIFGVVKKISVNIFFYYNKKKINLIKKIKFV